MDFCQIGLAVIANQSQAIAALSTRIDHNFDKACRILLACQGHIVVTGVGKSGHIARKFAATLSSTGTPAFFMHAGEANHGDLGMITNLDRVIAISNSGSTPEIIALLPLIKRLNVPLITLTGHAGSILAKAADVNLDIRVHEEACPLGLAPTTSTTAALVMSDALAIALLKTRGFTPEAFAQAHPGGTLGRRLILTVDALFHAGEHLPCVFEQASIREALIEVTAKKLGMTCVVNDQGVLTGVYTDGDVRRTLTRCIDIDHTLLLQVMTQHCKTITSGMRAIEALALMEQHTITSLVVVDDHHRPVAVIHLHDILRAGVI